MKSKTLLFLLLGVIIIGAVGAISYRLIPRESSIPTMFVEVPEQPRDFLKVKTFVESGELADICLIGEGYYENPEFYPTWPQGRQSFYDNHDYGRWGVHGYGAYPGESVISVRNLKEGEQITLCSFFKTSWGIETYQGVRLVAKENEYFSVKILIDGEEVENLVLPPTFPVFKDGWAKKMSVVLTAKKDIPVGEYRFPIRVERPDGRFNNQMILELLAKEPGVSFDYAKECSEKLAKGSEELDKKCKEFMQLREHRYIPGGGWGTGTDMYSAKVIVVE